MRNILKSQVIFGVGAFLSLVAAASAVDITWSSMTVSLSGCTNNNENGLYVWTSNNGFHGTPVFTHSPTYWWGTPFIEYEEGLGWVLENGVGSKSIIFGGEEDIFSIRSSNFRIDSQAQDNSATCGGSAAATKEPVNVINGGMFFDEAEFALPAAGFGLEWCRSYNSA